MSRPDGGEEKIPRRRFVKVAGAAAIVAIAGAGLAYTTGRVLTPAEARQSATSVAEKSPTAVSETTATASSTVTDTLSTTRPAPTAASTTTGASSSGAASGVGSLVPENSFSIFWITDTQFLSETNPALYRMVTNWIVKNWSAYNGKLVIHTGDIVEDGSVLAEWQNADEAMSILTANGLPYSWCAGNHDDFVGGDPTSGWTGNIWTQSFNPGIVAQSINAIGYTSWVGDYHDGMNTAMTFRASGQDFLVINLEWDGDDTVIAWADSILSDPAYSQYKAIVAPHAYVDAYGLLNDPRWGSTIDGFVDALTAVLDKHADNVFLTLNGHFATDQGYNTPQPVNNRNLLMFDRQDCRDMPDSVTGRGADDSVDSTPDSDKVGGATVTILTFDVNSNVLFVKTYDLYTGAWRTDCNEQYAIALFSRLPAPVPVHHYTAEVPPILQ